MVQSAPDRYVAREIEREIRAAAAQFPALAVTGMRQTGKTTLIRRVFPAAEYVTLDDPLECQSAREDPRTFLTRAPQLIIDEIQALPELLPHIKIAADGQRRASGRFLLTGSQVFPLMSGLAESLAGRVSVHRLHPLSCAEMKWRGGLPPDNFQKIFNGFYPEVAVHGADRHRFFAAYVQTYLERDLRLLAAVHDLRLFQTFVELLAARVGGLLNLSEISKEAGVSFSTAQRWLSLLESAGLVFLLRPWSRNLTRRATKSPKLYFGDTGLAAWLLRYHDSETLRHGPQSGALFENFVILECLKRKANRGLNCEFYFYRDSNANEIDLIADCGFEVALFEIKQTATPQPQHFKILGRLLPLFPNATGYVVSQTPRRRQFVERLLSLPVHEAPDVLGKG
ncbi:MAG: ATP-binding protein [Verrucomicrobiales bacterium]|jgi:predicted AAA+ superfamily ATPase|nr:ATP-binding protein [Verrucomicrobiales bacterium]